MTHHILKRMFSKTKFNQTTTAGWSQNQTGQMFSKTKFNQTTTIIAPSFLRKKMFSKTKFNQTTTAGARVGAGR